jgi:hypothetical protein
MENVIKVRRRTLLIVKVRVLKSVLEALPKRNRFLGRRPRNGLFGEVRKRIGVDLVVGI